MYVEGLPSKLRVEPELEPRLLDLATLSAHGTPHIQLMTKPHRLTRRAVHTGWSIFSGCHTGFSVIFGPGSSVSGNLYMVLSVVTRGRLNRLFLGPASGSYISQQYFETPCSYLSSLYAWPLKFDTQAKLRPTFGPKLWPKKAHWIATQPGP